MCRLGSSAWISFSASMVSNLGTHCWRVLRAAQFYSWQSWHTSSLAELKSHPQVPCIQSLLFEDITRKLKRWQFLRSRGQVRTRMFSTNHNIFEHIINKVSKIIYDLGNRNTANISLVPVIKEWCGNMDFIYHTFKISLWLTYRYSHNHCIHNECFPTQGAYLALFVLNV